jgi:hypothetical protein
VAEHHREWQAEVMPKAQNKPKDTDKKHGHEPLARLQALRTDLRQSNQGQVAPPTDLSQSALVDGDRLRHLRVSSKSDLQVIADELWLRGASVTSESSQ